MNPLKRLLKERQLSAGDTKGIASIPAQVLVEPLDGDFYLVGLIINRLNIDPLFLGPIRPVRFFREWHG